MLLWHLTMTFPRLKDLNTHRLNLGAPTINLGAPTQNFGASSLARMHVTEVFMYVMFFFNVVI